jgi:myo-inositol-1(or 4)-monophosphatase
MRLAGAPMSALPADADRARFKAVAVETAEAAGRILIEHAEHGFRVEHKQTIDLVTDADRAAEQAIVERLRSAFPQHEILAEERGLSAPRSSPFRWVVDPLDGTTNFAHRLPIFGVSIALEYEGRIILGVVLDPTRQERYVAELGRGAELNGRALRVSPTAALTDALLVTGFAYDIRETSNNNLNHFSRFALAAQGVRRLGAAALDLAYLAAGRFDGFWEMKLHPWDMAAGALLVTEAGGRMSRFDGGPFSIYGDDMVASNGRVHDAMLAVLKNR